MAKTKLFEAWSFRLQQPAPFDDPKYAGSKSMGFSQYNTSSTAQKSTLHAPTMRALLAYAKLVSATENGQSVDGLGAIGHQGTTYRISEYRSANKTDCVVFNPVTGKFNAAQVEDGTQALKPYSVGAGNGTGSGLLFCLMPVLNEDDEFRQKFQEFVSLLESGWADMDSRKTDEIHQEVIDSVFHTTAPMSAAEQKEAFQNALSEALGDACNMELVQSIHDRLRDQIEQHKESHDPEPLELSVSDAAAILRDNGVEEEKILAFRDSCATQFGDGATLNPANLIDSSRFEVKTADATISVGPEHSYLVETRIIDGRKYLLIPADEDIEVNGFGVRVKGE